MLLTMIGAALSLGPPFGIPRLAQEKIRTNGIATAKTVCKILLITILPIVKLNLGAKTNWRI